MIHDLKIWPEHFKNVRAGIKTAEIRRNDRNYHPGDVLVLREFDQQSGEYTGEVETRTVTHVLEDVRYLQPGMAMLSMSESKYCDEEIETILYELGNLADKFADQPMSNVYRHIKHIETLVSELKETGGERDELAVKP